MGFPFTRIREATRLNEARRRRRRPELLHLACFHMYIRKLVPRYFPKHSDHASTDRNLEDSDSPQYSGGSAAAVVGRWMCLLELVEREVIIGPLFVHLLASRPIVGSASDESF